MSRGPLAKTDGDLLRFAQNFSTLFAIDPTQYGGTPAMSASLATKVDDFQAKLAACDPGVRNKVATLQKSNSRDSLVSALRLLFNLVNAQANVTDSMKAELGMTVRSRPTRIPPPAFSPVIDIESVDGWTVYAKIHGPDDAGRGLPAGCDGISIFSFTGGDEAPTDPSRYKFEANTTKTKVAIAFPETLAPGTKVWLTAFYYNERKESGNACSPVSATIQYASIRHSG
jgi:hypothetical protein